LLSVQGVCKSYANVDAVSDVGFSVAPGEIVALIGPNGAGKTSLFRMIIGSTLPDKGAVVYHSLDGTRSAFIPSQELGYLPEERGLYQDAKVVDVLVYIGELRGVPAREAKARALELLDRLGIGHHAKRQVQELSKGNQQKVQFAACLVNRPRIVILDEPFAGLDPPNQEQMLAAFAQLRNEGVAVLLSAHHLSLVERLADRTIILSNGKVAAVHGGLEYKPGREDPTQIHLECVAEPDGLSELAALPGVQVRTIGRFRYSILVPPGAAVDAVLGRLMLGGDVRSVRINSQSLHDAFMTATVPEAVE
jgi:ABC-2 type transport system ATP-binding protein